jgi:hypothetical protein
MFPYPPSGWGYGPQSGEFAIEQREILIERAKGSFEPRNPNSVLVDSPEFD